MGEEKLKRQFLGVLSGLASTGRAFDLPSATRSESPSRDAGRRSHPVKKLYVGNVPYQATEEELRSFFEQAGVTVESAALVRDRYSGEPRGFGFVEIVDDNQAQQAIDSLNGKDFLGRNLLVNEARPPRERGFGGGGGGGGRGRGGGGGGGGRSGGGGGRRRRAALLVPFQLSSPTYPQREVTDISPELRPIS